MGGTGEYPTYDNYTSNNNYSETLRLEYNPSVTTYSDLLDAYWTYQPGSTDPCYDPAYCLRIFTNSPEQAKLASASIAAASKKAGQPVTAILYNAADYTFWKAEDYHQNYFSKGGQTCGTPPSVFQAYQRKANKTLTTHA